MEVVLKKLNKLPDSSRVWVYQSNKALSNDEVDFIERNMDRFIQTWAAHGKDLFADFEIITPYFLVVAVDDTKVPPSGCSIDASVHFIQELQGQIKLDFFDRLNVVYQNGEKLEIDHINQLVEKVESEALRKETLVFDNMIQTLGDMKREWVKPLNETWIQTRLN